MKKVLSMFLALVIATASCGAQEPSADERPAVLLVVGAGGGEEYASTFSKWATSWQKACALADVRLETIGLGEGAGDSLAQLRSALGAAQKDGLSGLWLVLLGHGTADATDAKFNLTGDDLAASELATLLKPFTRPVIVIAGFSSSGAFLAPLSAPGRIVVTATKSGSERNFARFGGYLGEAIANPAADFDKDGQTSLLEAWLSAAQNVAKFYEEEGRLATEHSLLDDNGDGKGTPADFFRGVRAVKKAKDGSATDGARAQQVHLVSSPEDLALSRATRAERDALEIEVAALRERRATMEEAAFYSELERLLLKLARLYEAAPSAHAPTER